MSFSEETKTALDTTHGHPVQQRMPQLLNQQQTTTQVPRHHHIDDEFCNNCSSCGGQDVTSDSLTLQRKDQYGSLPMVSYSHFLKPLYSISSSSKTKYRTSQIIFLQQHEWSSIPRTGRLFLPNLTAAQLWKLPSLLSKKYSWLLPQQQVFWNSHSIEAENLWILIVMPVQRKFTFYPKTQYDWINSGGHTYKNTTHQNNIMHYLEFIFLNCTAVMPPTLPLTFWCLNEFQFPFTWWWKTDLFISSCIIHLSFYLLKKKRLEF